MIQLRNVEKAYLTGAAKTYVLRQANLDVREGEFLTIMGPSGAGKTTLLTILGMLTSEWTGEYWFHGHAVHAMSTKERAALGRQYIGFVFQQYHLIDDLTVAENLDLPLSYRNVPKGERQAAVADSLDRFGIVAKKDLFPSQLSGGQQQLVAVARALIGEPAVVLADEPTGSLHSSQGKMIMDTLKGLNKEGITIIQVTHNEEWAAYGDRIVQVFDGWFDRESAAGTPAAQQGVP